MKWIGEILHQISLSHVVRSRLSLPRHQICCCFLTRCFLHAFFGMVLNAQLDQVYNVHLRWGKSDILLNKHQRYFSAFRLVCILSVFHIDFHLTQYSLFQRRVFPESFFILTAELTITEARAKMFFQTQTARRPLKLTLTFKFIRARHLPCEFCTDPFSGSQDISYITKNSHKQCQKQSLTQFTVCGKDKDNPNSITLALFWEECKNTIPKLTVTCKNSSNVCILLCTVVMHRQRLLLYHRIFTSFTGQSLLFSNCLVHSSGLVYIGWNDVTYLRLQYDRHFVCQRCRAARSSVVKICRIIRIKLNQLV